jgi:hypothetical protein
VECDKLDLFKINFMYIFEILMSRVETFLGVALFFWISPLVFERKLELDVGFLIVCAGVRENSASAYVFMTICRNLFAENKICSSLSLL